jgi:hypothetical protein
MRASELYEGFIIEPRSKQLDSGDWQPGSRVFRLLDGVVHEYFPLSECNQTFASEEEAEDFALGQSKYWVDHH